MTLVKIKCKLIREEYQYTMAAAAHHSSYYVEG